MTHPNAPSYNYQPFPYHILAPTNPQLPTPLSLSILLHVFFYPYKIILDTMHCIAFTSICCLWPIPSPIDYSMLPLVIEVPLTARLTKGGRFCPAFGNQKQLANIHHKNIQYLHAAIKVYTNINAGVILHK